MTVPLVTLYFEDDDEIDSNTKYLIEKAVTYVLTQEKHMQDRVGIVFVSKEVLQSYNKQYRNQEYYPDILSFKSDEPEYLGDILLCREIIAIQAKEYKVSVREELLRLVIHGLMHLLGHTHNGYDTSQSMLQKQELFLQKIIEKESCVIF